MKNYLARIQAQDGIALLMSIMIMAGIAVITVTVAFFVVQEIRASRSSALTEPAIIAAETAGEQGIFYIKKGTFTTDCASAPYTQLDGVTSGGNTNTRIRKCITSLPAVFQVNSTAPLEIYLYDPNNVNGNLCLEDDTFCPPNGGGVGNQLYSSLVVQHLTGFSVNVDIDTLDGVNYANNTVNPNTTVPFTISRDIVGSSDERLKIVITPTAGTATVQISTTGLYTGLPDYRTVDAEGCVSLTDITNCDNINEIFKRRINITLPR